MSVRVSRTRDARLFLLMLVLMCAEAMLEFAYRIADSETAARLCWRVNGHWPFILAVLLHFVLVLTDRHAWTDRPARMAVLYSPAAIFAVFEWGGHHITGAPIHRWWGWTYGPPETETLRIVAFVWVLGTLLSSAALVARSWWQTPQGSARKRYGWAAVGIGVGLSTSLLEVYFSLVGLEVPPLTAPAYAFTVLPIAYGIVRYEMFELTPMVAAEGIIATMCDALFLVDPDGRILYANQAAGSVIGCGKRALVGQSLQSLLEGAPDWVGQVGVGDANCGLDLPNQEASLSCQNGSLVQVLLAGTTVRGTDGKLRGAVVICRDISELQRAKAQLQQYGDHLEDLVRARTDEILATNLRLQHEIEERRNIELQAGALEAQLHHAQKMEAVGRLAGGVAHDFNNLLTGIVGFAELLFASLPDEDERRGDVSEILQASNRAGELIQQLLAFSRKQPVHRRMVDLDQLVASLHKMLSLIIGANVELSVRPGPGLHLIDIDAGQLQQVLVNLVVNARDAMPNGGSVEISTQDATLSENFCRLHSEVVPGRYIQVTVRDTGHGMSADVLAKAFEPFYTTKEAGKGTGLGLSTVYGLVRQNQGCIEVHSEVGQGTTFNIFFPRAVGTAFSAFPPPVVLARGGTETVLVVDDEPALRRLATRVLGRQGYKVCTAPDATQALVELQHVGGRIDLLLTDMIMPGPSGMELAQDVKRLCPTARIMFMTGYSEQTLQPEATGQDELHLLHKPFSAETLLQKVRANLDHPLCAVGSTAQG